MNRYGVDTSYFKEKLNLIVRDIDNYKPTDLHRELDRLAGAVGPSDKCEKCGKQSLVIFDEEWNECLECQHLQDILGT